MSKQKNPKKIKQKNSPKKYQQKKIQKKYSKTKFHAKIISPKKFASYHTHRITLVVSHSSYHTHRITLPRYFRWNMTNIGAINITLVYDNKRLSHGWQCDMIFIKRVVVRYHERARNERVSDITPTRV